MHVVMIAGARPNFVKIAPLTWEAAQREQVRHTLVHTGQHYDVTLSESFFDILSIPRPDVNLEVGSASHGVQTGRVMMALEPLLHKLKPDWVVTVGDVNSTAAAALVAVKLGIRTAHVEAGLRSFDRTMPEEVNRLVTDAISDLLLVTEQSGWDNLRREGVAKDKIVFTGNVMIDSLVNVLPRARDARIWESYGFEKGEYLLVTLHRPSNVDALYQLQDLMQALADLSQALPVLFPVHPRTRKQLENFDLLSRFTSVSTLNLVEPLDYLHFLSLVTAAKGLITDSGGIQEETTYLGVPCITLRPNTERPVTIELGTNELVEPTGDKVREAGRKLIEGNWKQGRIPPLWDGHAAARVMDALQKHS